MAVPHKISRPASEQILADTINKAPWIGDPDSGGAAELQPGYARRPCASLDLISGAFLNFN
jgi:hypothetical protein